MHNEKTLTHIDLFSGIGGFTLAAEWAGFKTVVFCEKEEFCQKVLQKRFGAIIADSTHRNGASWGMRSKIITKKIRDGKATGIRCSDQNSGESVIADTEHNGFPSPTRGHRRDKQDKGGEKKQDGFKQSKGSHCQPPLLIPEIRDLDGTKYCSATLLTGGFPCQPFSVAGQRRGKEDDRYLWPEMLRIINEAKPHWILAENVPGIFHMALDTVLADLEGEGYTTGTFIIPACGLNAPHRRNRIWIVANSRCQHGKGAEDKAELGGSIPEKENAPLFKRSIKDDGFGDATDSYSKRLQERRANQKGSREILSKTPTRPTGENWQEGWHEVATRFCRVDDGIPDRVHRLKALGNAIVPQVAYEILKNIAWIEKCVLKII